MNFIVFRDDQTTTGLFVQAMNDARPKFASDPTQSGAMMKQGIDQGPVTLSRSRMNDQANWFIDHRQELVLEKEIKRDDRRSQISRNRRRFVDGHNITHVYGLARFDRLAI